MYYLLVENIMYIKIFVVLNSVEHYAKVTFLTFNSCQIKTDFKQGSQIKTDFKQGPQIKTDFGQGLHIKVDFKQGPRIKADQARSPDQN